MEFRIRTDIDERRLLEKVKHGVVNAQKKLDAQVLKDSNRYVPQDTGTLQKSGILHTVIGSGKVVWDTPYAKKQYYGVTFDHSKQRNPDATAKWFETAKARCLETWRRIAQGAL